jgi:hypothetical protein
LHLLIQLQRSRFEFGRRFKNCTWIHFPSRFSMNAFVLENRDSTKYRLIWSRTMSGFSMDIVSDFAGSEKSNGDSTILPCMRLKKLQFLMKISPVCLLSKYPHCSFTSAFIEKCNHEWRFFCEILVRSLTKIHRMISHFRGCFSYLSVLCHPLVIYDIRRRR